MNKNLVYCVRNSIGLIKFGFSSSLPGRLGSLKKDFGRSLPVDLLVTWEVNTIQDEIQLQNLLRSRFWNPPYEGTEVYYIRKCIVNQIIKQVDLDSLSDYLLGLPPKKHKKSTLCLPLLVKSSQCIAPTSKPLSTHRELDIPLLATSCGYTLDSYKAYLRDRQRGLSHTKSIKNLGYASGYKFSAAAQVTNYLMENYSAADQVPSGLLMGD